MLSKRIVAGSMSLAFLLSAASAGAAFESYMVVKGAKQGSFKGSALPTASLAMGRIALVDFSYSIESPRDPQSGLPTGKRQHAPLVIRKETDETTPKFATALATNETLMACVLSEPEPGVAGGTITISLTNAHVASVSPLQPDAKHPELDRAKHYETIALTYERLDIMHSPSGKTESFSF
jgi:type VI secretion system secreted protein Hcp